MDTAFFDRVNAAAPLSRDERLALAALTQSNMISLTPGTALATARVPTVRGWMIGSGWAYWHSGSAAKPGQIYGFLLPGDVIGLSHAWLAHECLARGSDEATPLPFAITALTAVDAALISGSALSQLAAQHPRTFSAMLALDAVETSGELQRRITLTPARASRARLASEILSFSDRLARTSPGSSSRFNLPVNQALLASYLGMTSVHISRLMGDLRRDGIIAVSRGRMSTVTIKDAARLRAIAEG